MKGRTGKRTRCGGGELCGHRAIWDGECHILSRQAERPRTGEYGVVTHALLLREEDCNGNGVRRMDQYLRSCQEASAYCNSGLYQ